MTLMRITTGGKVGIGTTSPDPAAKLEVNGQVKITGGSSSAGKVLTSDANGLASWSAGREYLLYEDVKAPGTGGGQFVSGAWRTRDLTQETIDTAGIGSLSSNQITLSAGTYECFISAPAIDVGAHQIRLYNVTDSSVIKYGTSEISYEGGWGHAVTRSIIIYRFTLTAQKTLRIEHRATVTSDTSNGFGTRNNFGGDEVYTVAEFWRVNS